VQKVERRAAAAVALLDGLVKVVSVVLSVGWAKATTTELICLEEAEY
jgi:hypothetical protein